MITTDTKLPQLKMGFLHALYNIDLFKYDVEELMAQRNCSDFTRYWNLLHEECPTVKDTYYETIRNDTKKIHQSLPKKLHHDIALCICEDYRLIATYLIANKSNSDKS